MRERLLIRGGYVISMDDSIGDLPRGDVLIADGEILAVGGDLPASDAEVIDARDRAVLPGFVDAHRHAWTSVLRAAQADLTLAHYRDLTRHSIAFAFRPEDVHVGTLLSAWEALNGGITTLLDYAHLNRPTNTPRRASRRCARRAFGRGTRTAARWACTGTWTHRSTTRLGCVGY